MKPPKAMKTGSKENHPMIQPKQSPALYRMCVNETATKALAVLSSRFGTRKMRVLFMMNNEDSGVFSEEKP